MSDITKMLQGFLSSLGFEAMARDVLTETDPARIRHYARVVLKQIPAEQKQAVHSRFVMLGLV